MFNTVIGAMAGKTIALDSEAYEILSAAKNPGETFSQVVKRRMRPRVPLSSFAGAWSHVPKRTLRAIRAGISASRDVDTKRRAVLVSRKRS